MNNEAINEVIGVWLIDNTGFPLIIRIYTNSEESLIDSVLFSGFITAIVAFSKNVVKDSLETIVMAGHSIHCLAFPRFSVVTTTNKLTLPTSKLQIQCLMAEIGKKFYQMYQEELDRYERNTAHFTDFELIVDQLLGQRDEGKKKSLNDFEIGFILTQVRFKKITAQEAIKRIYTSFKRLDKHSQQFIRKAMNDFEGFFTTKSGLATQEILMYKEIVGKMTALMKSEKFFQSF